MGPLGGILASLESGGAPRSGSGVCSGMGGPPNHSGASGLLHGHELEGDLLFLLPSAENLHV